MIKEKNANPHLYGRRSSSHGRTRAGVHFADFVPKGLPWLWTHATVGARHLMKDYSLPVVLTLLLVFMISVIGLIRISDQASLADLLANVTTITQDYDSLVSGDKADAPQRGDTSGDPGANPAPAGATTSFVLNSGGSPTTGGGTTGGGGSQTPTPIFAASIGSFQQGSTTLECNGITIKKNCSKRYIFTAQVNTQNGPGVVNYGWRSNIGGASEDGSYTAVSGNSNQTLQKSVSIPCQSQSATYNMQFVILSPAQVQSTTLSFNHNCIGI